MSEKVVGTTQSALDASTATTWSKVVSKHKNGDEMASCGLDGAIQGGAGDLANVS